MTDREEPRPGDPIAQLVVVCHANIARSPLAMAMLEDEARRRLGPTPDLWIRSAGVRALDGHPAAEPTRRRAAALGLDLEAHRATLLTRSDVVEADLVLTMSERQRGHAVHLHPPARHRTFTLPELARLCAQPPPADAASPVRTRVREVARLASRSRPFVDRPDRAEDVADPYGGPEDGYATMAEHVGALVQQVAGALFGPERP